MKLVTLTLILITALLLSGQTRPDPVDGGPPQAAVILCESKFYRAHEKAAAAAAFVAQGCDHIEFIEYHGTGWWLGYGTKVQDYDR